MNANSPPRCPTTDEVIHELRIYYSHATGRPLSECASLIQKHTTINELNRLDPDLDWVGFHRHFGIPCPEYSNGRFDDKSTLEIFCQFLASRIEVPPIRSITILGKRCESAGLFLDIKKRLVELGEDDSSIAPSSLLGPYLSRHKTTFGKVRWYAPGKLPAMNVSNRLAEVGCLAYMFIPISTAIYNGLTSKFAPEMPSIWIYSLGLFSVSLMCMAVGITFRHQLEHASFEGLTDFRSLVKAILDRPQIRIRKQHATWAYQ